MSSIVCTIISSTPSPLYVGEVGLEPGGLTHGSLIGNAKPVTHLDAYRGSEVELIVAKSAQVRTDSLAVNESLAQAFGAVRTYPAASGFPSRGRKGKR